MRARTGCSDSWNKHQGLLANSRSIDDFYRARLKYESGLCVKVLAEQNLLFLFYILSICTISASVSLQNNLMDFTCYEQILKSEIKLGSPCSALAVLVYEAGFWDCREDKETELLCQMCDWWDANSQLSFPKPALLLGTGKSHLVCWKSHTGLGWKGP